MIKSCPLSTSPGLSGECPSWENECRDNEMHCGYDGGSISTFTYFQGENDGGSISTFTYFQGESYVPSWCEDHAATNDWDRLHTSGNTKICP